MARRRRRRSKRRNSCVVPLGLFILGTTVSYFMFEEVIPNIAASVQQNSVATPAQQAFFVPTQTIVTSETLPTLTHTPLPTSTPTPLPTLTPTLQVQNLQDLVQHNTICVPSWYANGANQINYENQGSIIITGDGLPQQGTGFFPFGIYYLPRPPGAFDNPDFGPDAEINHNMNVWQRVSNACINTIVMQPYGPKIFEHAREFGMMMIPRFDTYDEKPEELIEFINFVDNHPSMLWFYGKDEPNLIKNWNLISEKVTRLHKKIHNNAVHDTLILHHRMDQPNFGYSSDQLFNTLLGDIWGADFYHNYSGTGKTFNSVRQLSSKKESGISNSTFVVLPAHFNYNQSRGMLRQRIDEAIVGGANGIALWDWPECEYNKPCLYESLWNTISEIGHELHALMPWLTGSNPEYGNQNGIAYMVRQGPNDSQMYYLVNLTQESRNYTLNGLPAYEILTNVFTGDVIQANEEGNVNLTIPTMNGSNSGKLVLISGNSIDIASSFRTAYEYNYDEPIP